MTGEVSPANGMGDNAAHGLAMCKQELHLLLLGVFVHFGTRHTHRQINPCYPQQPAHIGTLHGHTQTDGLFPERDTEFFKGDGNTGIQQGFRTLFLYPPYNGIIHTLSTINRVIDFVRSTAV